MIENKKVKKILYGEDYNPEQLPEEIWKWQGLLRGNPLRQSFIAKKGCCDYKGSTFIENKLFRNNNK